MPSARKLRGIKFNAYRASVVAPRKEKDEQDFKRRVREYVASSSVGGGCNCSKLYDCGHKHLEPFMPRPSKINPKKLDRASGARIRRKRLGRRE